VPDPDLKILHVAPIGSLRYQGLDYSIPGLIAAQARLGVDVTLLTTWPGGRLEGEQAFPVLYFRDQRREAFLRHSRGEPWDLMVFHSTYIPYQAALAHSATLRGIPYILTPRGGMTEGAMARKRWKKKLGDLLFFSRMVRQATALHFLTQREARSSQKRGRPFFVVGNGIDLPAGDTIPGVKGQADRLNLVFIGRLDLNHKGLDLLLEALAQVKNKGLASQLRVRLFGPDVDGGGLAVRDRVRQLDLESWVELPGPVYGSDKQDVLLDTDLFILTSRFEGHPMAVLEALAYGVPCILTPGTNVADEVAESGAGWKVGPEPAAIADGIARAVREKQRLPEMGRAARSLVSTHHTWDVVARKTVGEYRSCLCGTLGV
jgi:glycosyltransferase involved in cell wall biosynthesis